MGSFPAPRSLQQRSLLPQGWRRKGWQRRGQRRQRRIVPGRLPRAAQKQRQQWAKPSGQLQSWHEGGWGCCGWGSGGLWPELPGEVPFLPRRTRLFEWKADVPARLPEPQLVGSDGRRPAVQQSLQGGPVRREAPGAVSSDVCSRFPSDPGLRAEPGQEKGRKPGQRFLWLWFAVRCHPAGDFRPVCCGRSGGAPWDFRAQGSETAGETLQGSVALFLGQLSNCCYGQLPWKRSRRTRKGLPEARSDITRGEDRRGQTASREKTSCWR